MIPAANNTIARKAIKAMSKKNTIWGYAAKNFVSEYRTLDQLKQFCSEFVSAYEDNPKSMEKVFTERLCKTLINYHKQTLL